MDYYLKFASEEEAKALLYRDEVACYANIDIIGTIYNDDAEFDEDGNIVTPATQVDGWHVNVRLIDNEDGDVLIPFVIPVKTPLRIWAI